MEACCLIVVAFFAICIGLEYIENSIKEGKKREAERQRQEYERQEKSNRSKIAIKIINRILKIN